MRKKKNKEFDGRVKEKEKDRGQEIDSTKENTKCVFFSSSFDCEQGNGALNLPTNLVVSAHKHIIHRYNHNLTHTHILI